MQFDFVVIGAGLSGLSIARTLTRENAKVLLVEGQDTLEGTQRQIESPAGLLNNGLRILPESPTVQGTLEFLQALLPQPLTIEVRHNEVVTYEAGGFRPFIGFGDKPPKFLDQLRPLISGSEYVTTPRVGEWSALLAGTDLGTVQTRTYGTRFEIADGRVKSLTVNGQKKIVADQFIFCGPLAQLKTLIPQEFWDAKALSRFARIKYWTMVGVDFVHATPTGATDKLYVLDGTTADDLGPCIGKFQVAADAGQASQWLTFLEDEDAEDSEALAHVIKKVKRQIKRAFPEAFENLVFERVCVFPSWSASLPNSSFLPEFENLRFGNGQLSPLPGACGSLGRAQVVLKDLGFVSQLKAETPVLSESENSPEPQAEL